MDPIQKIVTYFLKLRDELMRRRKVVTALAAIVVFVTAYALTLPAITLDQSTAQQQGGISLEQPAASQDDGSQVSSGEQASEGSAHTSQPQPDGAASQAQQSAPLTGELTYQSPDAPDAEAHFTAKAEIDASAKLPQGTQLKVTEISSAKAEDKDSYQAHRAAALAKLQQQDAAISGFSSLRLFDVSFVDASGHEVEPAADVDVNISAATPVAVQDAADVQVLHFQDGNKPADDLTNISVVDKDHKHADPQDGKLSEVGFASSSFSVFALGVAERSRTLTAEAGEGAYKVSVSYDGTAKLPEDTTLAVTTLADDSDAYNAAKDAVVAAKKTEDQSFEEKGLGLAALDVTLHDGNGNEIEPQGNVDIKIEMSSLPKDAAGASLEVQHITGAGSGDGSSTQTAQTVASGIKATDGSATAEFSVDGFSTFTITWTTKVTDGQSETDYRFATVQVHYVDANGLEVGDPTSVPASSLNDGTDADASKNNNIVDLSSWANDESGSSRISGYTFTGAHLEGTGGPTITGLKAEKGAPQTRTVDDYDDNGNKTGSHTETYTGYGLFYTTDATVSAKSSWTQYKDSTSGTSSNNVNVYLVYGKNPDVWATVHFMTAEQTPQPIKDADGNDVTAVADLSSYAGTSSDARGPSGSHDFASKYASKNVPNGYTYTLSETNTSSNANRIYHSSGDISTPFRFINYYGGVLYWARGNVPWTAFGSEHPDIYITFARANQFAVTVHHVDANGNQVASDTTASMGNGSSLMLDGAKADISGYTPSTAYFGWQDKDNKGTEFSSLSYGVNGNLWKTSYTTGDNSDSADTPGPVSEVWVVYNETPSTTVTVHHLNEQGVEIHDATTKKMTDGGTLNLASASESINNYTPKRAYFNQDNAEMPLGSLAYAYTAGEGGTDGAWSSTYKASDADAGTATATLVQDVYVVYQPNTLGTLTFHHVDTEGVQLATNTTYASGNNGSNYDNKWNGFSSLLNGSRSQQVTGVGTYLKSYVGYFGNSAYDNSNAASGLYGGIAYKHDSVGWHTAVTNNASNGPWKEFHPLTDTTNSQPVLLTDIYQVYTGYKGIRVHHVDEAGKPIAPDTYQTVQSGGSIDYQSLMPDEVSGYALKDAHMGSYTGQSFFSLAYTYDTGSQTWSTTYKADASDNDHAAASAVNDVWLVYQQGGTSKTFTAHYVYLDGNGDIQSTDTADATFTVSSGASGPSELNGGGNPQYARRGDGINTIANDKFLNKTVHPADSDTDLAYVTTRMGSATGPEMSWVKLDNSGKTLFLTGSSATEDGNASTTYTLARQGGRNVWTYATQGRTFTLSRDSSGNFSLNDTLTGTHMLNLTESGGTPIFTATYRGNNQVTQYSVEQSSVGAEHDMNYVLTVEDWLASDSSDIYFVYRDANNEISIDNDLVFTGRLKVAWSDETLNKMYGTNGQTKSINSPTYTWYKITTTDLTKTAETLTDDDLSTGSEVLRTQRGTDWNIAYEPSDRTWLDVEADDGARTTTQKVFYRVRMNYKDEKGAEQSTWSKPLEIEYFGQLENGSFETPVGASQYSNENYKKQGGVWQTTGPGITRAQNYAGRDIEIVSGTDHQVLRNSYHWQNGDDSQASWAEEGNQFAELNAENAGALYQDVITHPDEELSYKLSHRARGSSEADGLGYKYDTMYLVIMPTKIAMTSGSNGKELQTQADLQSFIQAHGGFDTSTATEETSQVTYQDFNQGILIRKISSGENGWHTVDVMNGYLAKAGLTRFFFCAASTAGDLGRNQAHNLSDPPTQGNFLDNVSFTQDLPTPDGFHLTVSKTFSGLTSTQIASLATNARDVEGSDLSNGKTDPFTITLSNRHVNSSTGREDNDPANTALNGAKLTFTASGSGGSYAFTPHAVDASGKDLFVGRSSGMANVNADGSVTMTWTLADQTIDNASADQQFNYRADETGETVSGMTVNSSKTVSPEDAFDSDSVDIRQGTSGTISLDNSYSTHRDSDQPEVTIRKTFSGVTPTTVQSLWSNGYRISVTNSQGTTATLSAYDDQLSANAKLVSTTTAHDGRMTYVWSISGAGWGAGDYTVSETGLKAENNTLTKVHIQGSGNNDGVDVSVTPTAGLSDITNSSVISGTPNVSQTVGASLTYSTDAAVARKVDSVATGQTYSMPSGTNLIIAQYAIGDTANGNKKYLVWTSSPLGVKTSNAIVKKIREEYPTSGPLSSDDVFFRNGTNPGTITSNGATMTYDSGTGHLSFQNVTDGTSETDNRTWVSFYSTHYSVAGSSPETYDDQDITLDNVYNPIIKLSKVSANKKDDGAPSTQEPLSGAVFRLYRLDKDGQREYYLASSTVSGPQFGPVSDVDAHTTGSRDATSTDKALSFTSGEDGTVEIGSLPKPDSGNDVYYLEETAAPNGYYRLAKAVSFVVKADGAVELETAPGTGAEGETVNGPRQDGSVDNSFATVTYPDPYYLVTVSNVGGVVLPSTGGSGDIPYALFGAVLMGAALIGGCVLRHRRDGRQTPW